MSNSNLFVCVILCLFQLHFGVIYGLEEANKHEHACVIGAGISGLATARYLQQFGVTNFTVFEATRYVGGTWRFDPHVGVDQDGLPLFTSMYKYLRTNTPRETMEFPGFTFPEGTPSYPTGDCFYRYLLLFTKKFDLLRFIQFRSYVTLVKWADDHWELHYTNTESKTNHTVTCDYVVVGNGHYSKPRWPNFEGEKYFKGKIIHSHDYKEPEPYKNRKVLLVGAGPSGVDLATHLVSLTEKLVHSHHLVYNQPNFPKNYVKKPDIKKFTSNGVVFVDNSFEEVDDVIYCTGFDFEHPFVDQSAGVTMSSKFVLPLYQQIVNIRRPSMMFLGVAKNTITRLLDAQAEYAARIIAGKFKLPSQDHMLKKWLSYVYYLHSKEKKIVDVNLVGPLQEQYFANLTKEAGVTRVPRVLNDIRDFNAKIRLDDLLNYRDYDFNITSDDNYERYYHPQKNQQCLITI